MIFVAYGIVVAYLTFMFIRIDKKMAKLIDIFEDKDENKNV
jgi:hypothetical protein